MIVILTGVISIDFGVMVMKLVIMVVVVMMMVMVSGYRSD